MLISTYFELYPYMFVLFTTILGLLVGSFLNVVIYRLPVMMKKEWEKQCYEFLELPLSHTISGIKSRKLPLKIRKMSRFWKLLEKKRTISKKGERFNLVTPRSQCPHCKKPISAIENIPVISYLFLKGRCKFCSQHISLRYPLVELASAVLSGYIAWRFGFGTQALFALIFTWSLICLTMIDFDHQLLPDDITLPLLWLGLACNFFNMFTTIQSSLIGAMLGYGILWTIFIGFKLITGKEGMGYGDFKLLAMLGAWLGWEMLPFIILLSSLLGAIIGITLIVAGKQGRNNPIPFGPYLAFAGWIALIWEPEITGIYLKLV